MSAMEGAASAHKMKRTKRGSRNKKKNAKRIDLTEIAEHQEDVRMQERTGGLVASKTDEQLFVIEKSGEDVNTRKRPLTRKERARAKVLYNDAAMEPDSKVAPIASRPCSGSKALYRGAVSEQYRPPVTYRPPSKRRRTGGQIKEDLSVLEQDGSMSVNPPTAAAAQGPPELWERPATPPTVVDVDPWLRPVKVSKQPVKPPALHSKKEPTAIPAVEIPGGGISYNPAFSEHQKVLSKALKRELERIETSADVEKRVPAKRSNKEIGEAMFDELSRGLLPGHSALEDDASADLAALEDPDVAEAARAVAAGAVSKRIVTADNRKTRSQRNKQERHKERMRIAAEKKLRRARESEVSQIRNLKKQLAAQQSEEARRQAIKEVKKVEALKVPRKLGRKDFREAGPTYKLTDELTGALRTSKPEVNLVADRFASLQKRNEIEVRIPTKQRRRYKLKEYTKRSYKNYDLQESLRQQAKAKKAKAK